MNPDLAALSNQAINCALEHEWQKAIDLNKQILSHNEKDIPTLNRLAFAYIQRGEIAEAKTVYKTVLEIDKYNPIAQKSLERIAKIKNKKVDPSSSKPRTKASFLEEPGKTKTLVLVRPTDSSQLVKLSSGVPVNLVSKKRRISVETEDGDYIGGLPDDLAVRMAKLLQLGFTYECLLKGIQDKNISVFIREIKKPEKGKNLVSFPHQGISNISDLPALAVEAIDDEPVDVTPTGEEDDFQSEH